MKNLLSAIALSSLIAFSANASDMQDLPSTCNVANGVVTCPAETVDGDYKVMVDGKEAAVKLAKGTGTVSMEAAK